MAGSDWYDFPMEAVVDQAGRTARLVEEDGVLVSAGDTPVDDDVLFGLIDASRTPYDR